MLLNLSGIILSFFLSFVLITKRNKTDADYILVAWLSITGLHLLAYYFFTYQYLTYLSLIVLGFSLPLFHGPFLYLYTKQQTSSFPFNKKQLLHFLPVTLSILLFSGFYFMTEEQKVEVFKQRGKGFEFQSMINLYAVYASGLIYVPLSLIKLYRYRKNIVHQFSNTEKINFNWLLYLIIWMSIIWFIILVIRNNNLIYSSAALFVIWIGYFGIKQVQVFSQSKIDTRLKSFSNGNKILEETNFNFEEKTLEIEAANTYKSANISKYQKSSLNDEEATFIHEKLKNYLDEQKPFTNPDLTLNDLANSLNVHPNHLSQVINSKEKKNFYELINEKRIDEFIQLTSRSSSQQFTLLGLAFDCGFNSKSSFNRNFKKHTGFTPSDYLKNQLVN